MAVAKKAAAVVPVQKTIRKAAPANKRTNNVQNEVVGTTADPVYVRHQALNYARSLFATPTEPGAKLSAAQLVTAASKLESYMLNGRSATATDDD